MTATAKLLPGCIVLGWTLTAVWAPAGDFSVTASSIISHSLLGQDRDQEYSQRQYLEQLLVQAHQAMGQGKLDLAETLIGQAEQLDVKQDYLFAPLRDTPAKARKKLEQLRAEGAAAGDRPSSRYLPPLLKKIGR